MWEWLDVFECSICIRIFISCMLDMHQNFQSLTDTNLVKIEKKDFIKERKNYKTGARKLYTNCLI